MKVSLRSIADSLQAELIGDAAVEVSGIASIPRATPADLVFVEDEKHLSLALQSHAAAVIAGKFAEAKPTSKPLLISRQPKLTFARAARLLHSAPNRPPGIHPSAQVHASARLGKSVTVAERVVIGEDAAVGDQSWIGAGTVIGARVSVGCDCELYPNVTVYSGTRIGDRVIVHAGAVLGSDGFGYIRDRTTGHYEKFPQQGRLEIGDDVEIGA
ncbi:MAG TPA: UDP-3-O-(3-hydroxymyristoyl)glucosamine N-acyltransferase, partial [Candidatus Saccharimonadales bacterium]|nr:UDP-3-O-(3-hydroxymyristoyl)glucosamine N-acyltransferase [Candidatus Saccharimonadales bacterium]